MKRLVLFLSLIMVFALSAPAYAHFQMIYSPESVPKSKKLNLKLVFTHPFEAGKKKDLLNKLKPITFTSLTNTGRAYEANVRLKGMGDHIFYFVPAPYYEGSEDIYIQHCTKVIFNVAGAPTDWDQPVGDPLPVLGR